LKLLLWLVAAAAVAYGLWWATVGRLDGAPEVKFVKPRRETLISNLSTNGKAEPIEWAPVGVESPGLVVKLYVKLGQTVSAGAPVAQISHTGLADQVKAAEARTAQAQAELDSLTKGGRPAELTDIENNLAKARFERQTEQNDYSSLKRLYDRQAATMMEVQIASDKLHQTDLEIQSLERRRQSLVSKDDLAVSRARLAEAQASQRAAEARLAEGAVRSTVSGVVYNLPVRSGTYLNAGDLIADIGRIDRLRVRVYVDEPELGRVAVGQPVKITWDALPGKAWDGTVERMPTEIVPLGTRQVGEVLCTIENPNRELDPGANVNVSIRTGMVSSALTVPTEALHIENGQATVFVLDGKDRIQLRAVQHGSDSLTRVQIAGGLKDDEWVALPSDAVLKDGEKIKPVLQQ
jgi:HlyD family secretion protein